ncbi:MAG: A/G-specific adenine glycosylase [Actinomycetales bacterium]
MADRQLPVRDRQRPAAAAPRPPADLALLQAELSTWFDACARDLPWRAPDRTPWGVLVSEVMLQQTPVVRVLPVWRQWLDRWPTPHALASDSPGEAVRAWGRLGYPRRALRLHAAATSIVERHGGQVPDTYDDLIALPGIGDYTAAAVASFAFGRAHVVLDTNVRRVLARLLAGEDRPAAHVTAAERDLARSALPTDPDRAARWAIATMELGALVCTARDPGCARCPVAARCRWLRAGRPASALPAQRTQAWEGTDRQARGRLLAAVRASRAAVHRSALDAAWPDPAQRDRALAGLVEDGLLEPLPGELFQLPA